ncbi:cytochrome p450 734a1 [Phtheirospermum japonicum]|uniref:Cytochrome p450 734a1 n=1 Tax=Phtheirospermum japonicum TaxID=374723 RepID=A0A830CG42_9LAMI|nr:cytochrome p450 734a1 [Phtheirospermum japonicum]
MLPMMAKIMEETILKWSGEISKYGKVEIEVSDWFQNLAEEVITRVTFGSSYEVGRAIFEMQAIAHATGAYHKLTIPGYRFLLTKKNIISWRLENQIRESLLKIINDQRARTRENPATASGECPNDLLELMIKASDGSSNVTENEIVEECKTFLFAGKETTSNLLTWTAVLLAMHPQWQEQARVEVLRVCGARDTPTKDDLAKLKMLGMILNESLRLYPPVVATIRQAKSDVQLGGIHIPGGTKLIIPILAVHHNPGLWHHDADEFNPVRFASGEHQVAFMPFGLGARRCVGQNLAILQVKLVVAMILRRFTFELAPSYVHAPSVVMLLHPQQGAPLIFRKLQDR